ncbi:MAG TPA: hypothetical protein PLA24_04605 [Tenuifilaceae bacterium]|nr:hypothetical protein [Tenuifilaceae bacterium]
MNKNITMNTAAKVIETRGVIIKEEKVRSLNQKIYPNTMVLENYEPYPGYYGKNLPEDSAPRSVFLILVCEYDALHLARTLQKVGKEMQHNCNANIGYMLIDNKRFCCIRIKNLQCFERIPSIQEKLINHGIDFRRERDINKQVVINIEKTFLLERFDDDIYMDLAGDSKFYFEIPTQLTWEHFKTITDNVKHNIDNHFFDAALGYIWKLNGPQDIIRIYDLKANLERIKQIRKLFLHEIERFEKIQ